MIGNTAVTNHGMICADKVIAATHFPFINKHGKWAACIKADSTLTVNAGMLMLKSTGSGGKGINVDMEANFNGGEVYIITEGGQFRSNNDTSSPKGIKVDGNLTISGGTIWVRTSGNNGEGIETKGKLTITGGEVASYAYDDAINSKDDMTISGGYVYAQGKANDGLDANGNSISRADSSMPSAPALPRWPSMPIPRVVRNSISQAEQSWPWEDWRMAHN